MGRKTHKNATSDDSFLWRLCHALDQHPTDVAANAGIPYKEFKALLKLDAAQMPEPEYDEVWEKLSAYLSKHIGLMMASKYEINRMLQRSRTRKALRQERFNKFHDKR